LPQALLGGLEQPAAFLRGHALRIGRKGLLVLPGQQILLLAAYQIRAVHGEKALPLAHVLVGRIRKDTLNPAGKAGLHIREFFLVDVHIAGNAQIVVDILECHGRRRHADLLKALGRQLHGRQRGLSSQRRAPDGMQAGRFSGPRATTGSCEAACEAA
jgi:hypothetical protein